VKNLPEGKEAPPPGRGEAVRLPLDVPARKPGPSTQLPDGAPTLLKAAVVVGSQVNVVLRKPHVFEHAPPLGPAL
jgi:hypothetical protein